MHLARKYATLDDMENGAPADPAVVDADAWRYDEMRPDVWTWLQSWYVSQCNGDWEHQYGIQIGTLDNPGWSIQIDLTDSPLDGRPYARTEIHRSEDDWSVTWVESSTFHGAGGPLNLGEVLHGFRVWATT